MLELATILARDAVAACRHAVFDWGALGVAHEPSRSAAQRLQDLEAVESLVYELLDAHADTARLAGSLADDLDWQAHLDYLRQLQRIGRERLAAASRR